MKHQWACVVPVEIPQFGEINPCTKHCRRHMTTVCLTVTVAMSMLFFTTKRLDQPSSPSLFIPPKSYIVCDQAYALRTYQISGFNIPDTTCPERDYFNKKISCARRIVERVFGIIKKRYKILTRACEQSVSTKTLQVWAVLILHNMMIRLQGYDEAFAEDESFDLAEEPDCEPPNVFDDTDPLERGYARRDELVQEFWQDRP